MLGIPFKLLKSREAMEGFEVRGFAIQAISKYFIRDNFKKIKFMARMKPILLTQLLKICRFLLIDEALEG